MKIYAVIEIAGSGQVYDVLEFPSKRDATNYFIDSGWTITGLSRTTYRGCVMGEFFIPKDATATFYTSKEWNDAGLKYVFGVENMSRYSNRRRTRRIARDIPMITQELANKYDWHSWGRNYYEYDISVEDFKLLVDEYGGWNSIISTWFDYAEQAANFREDIKGIDG